MYQYFHLLDEYEDQDGDLGNVFEYFEIPKEYKSYICYNEADVAAVDIITNYKLGKYSVTEARETLSFLIFGYNEYIRLNICPFATSLTYVLSEAIDEIF